MRQLIVSLITLLAITTIGACARNDPKPADHPAHPHEHQPPHGGTAVALGQEAYHLEFVRDAGSGTLTAFVLDGHMESFIRIKAASFEVVASVDGEKRSLTCHAIANITTGESVGDTSQFDAQADWLKTTATFDAVLNAIEIRGTRFENVTFNFPKGNDAR
jgi:hypothetical protein